MPYSEQLSRICRKNSRFERLTRPINLVSHCFESGAGTRSRTRDLLITNQLLYQLSYAGIVSAVNDLLNLRPFGIPLLIGLRSPAARGIPTWIAGYTH